MSPTVRRFLIGLVLVSLWTIGLFVLWNMAAQLP
jgi:hypothetical protein